MIESLEKILNYFRQQLEKNEHPKRRKTAQKKGKPRIRHNWFQASMGKEFKRTRHMAGLFLD